VNIIKTISFPPLGDDRGSLVALEVHKTVPFDIKRVYYIFGTQVGVSRGFHAHRRLQQVAVCVTGKCRMVLDDGQRREEVWLNSPTKGLLIGDLIWREMHDFSPDCVLLVLASEHYDETDYIRSYEDFKKIGTLLKKV
jgi:dTDP-4-dehydrorhamnose 3,5-epimerase-like enzyme